MRFLPTPAVLALAAACGAKSPDLDFSRGEYQIIHQQSYVCIQPERDAPWKYKCQHTQTGEIIEMERIQRDEEKKPD